MISINEDFELQWFTPSTSEWQKLGVRHYQFSVVDGVSPSLDVIHKALQIIQRHAQRNESIYIHCKSGQGRSATIVASYLVKVIHIHHKTEMTSAQTQLMVSLMEKLMEQSYYIIMTKYLSFTIGIQVES